MVRSFPLLIPLLAFPVLCSPAARAQEGELTMVSPLPFKGVAKLVTRRLKRKNLNMRAVYPQFVRNTPVTRFANWKLREGAKERYREFLQQANKDFAEGFKTPAPYAYDELPQLHCYRAPRLISTARAYYKYMGGAHGIGATVATNFGQFSGMARPKELVLGDFFTGKTYRKIIEKKLLDKLRANKQQEATWVTDGTVTGFNAYQLNNFTVAPKGLTWYFAPYAVGPYAMGEYEVTLPFHQLPADFKKSVVIDQTGQ